MENKLIPLTEFINRIDELVPAKDYEMDYDTNSSQLNAIKRYAKFLSQPLTLSMFVPCDDKGNVLEEPYIQRMYHMVEHRPYSEIEKEYNKAKEKVLFEEFEFLEDEEGKYLIDKNDNTYYPDHFGKPTIQNLINDSLTLTPTALKQIYG